MSTAADNEYEAQNDVPAAGSDIPTGEAGDNDYTSRVGQKTAPVPVQKDEDPVEDPIDPATADTDEQLGTSICLLLPSSPSFLLLPPFFDVTHKVWLQVANLTLLEEVILLIAHCLSNSQR